jgi:hypothetical protein
MRLQAMDQIKGKQKQPLDPVLKRHSIDHDKTSVYLKTINTQRSGIPPEKFTPQQTNRCFGLLSTIDGASL